MGGRGGAPLGRDGSQILIADSASEAVLAVAIHLFELNKRLRVARAFHVEAAVLPHPYDVIVLRFQLVEEVEGPLAELLVALVAAVSKEDGYHGVDEEQLERRGREPFLLFFARMTEGVVRLPIRCDGATEQFACRFHVVAIEQLAQSGPSLIEQIGQLSNANMRKILRTEPQKLPKLEVDRLKRKLVL